MFGSSMAVSAVAAGSCLLNGKVWHEGHSTVNCQGTQFALVLLPHHCPSC